MPTSAGASRFAARAASAAGRAALPITHTVCRPAGNQIMRRHRAIGSVDFGVVERILVNTALQIVGDQQFRDAAEETEHAHMRAGPIRQLLRPGRLGISQVRSTEHSDKFLRFVDFACRPINNRYPACPSSLRTPFLRRRWCRRITGLSRRSNPRSRSQSLPIFR
jgi:hypothetical protein